MSPSQTHSNKSRRYHRKRGVAERYDVSERTVDRMARDGRLPPPDFYRGKIPFWGDDTLDSNDRAAALAARPAKAIGA